MQITVLGAGSIAGSIARQLAAHRDRGALPADIRLVVADLDETRARALADQVGGEGVALDITDAAALDRVVGASDVVAHAIGPFARFGRLVIDACVRRGVHCVDVCDEDVVAAEVFTDAELHEQAVAAGCTVLSGCGASPGITNLAAEQALGALDEARSLELFVAVPTMPSFGVTINEHMLASLSGEVLQLVDGELGPRPAWGDPVTTELAAGFGSHEFGYLGHPEPIQLARSHPGLTSATIRWSWLEPATNRLWQDLARLGLADDTTVAAAGMSPRRFLSLLLDDALGARMPGAVPSSRPTGSTWRLVAEGVRDGRPARAVVDNVIRYGELRCDPATLTGWLPAEAVVRLVDGRMHVRGVASPEQAFDDVDTVLDAYAAATGCAIGLRLDQPVAA